MSAFEVPVPLVDDYNRFELSMDGTTYSLETSWNRRAGLWYLSVFLPGATGDTREPIIQGQAMVCYRLLMEGINHPSRPAGDLWIVGKRDPERLDFGTYAKLYYFDAQELAITFAEGPDAS